MVCRRIALQRLIEAPNDGGNFIPASAEEIEWHPVIHALPTNMQNALLNELEHGNSIAAWTTGRKGVASLFPSWKNPTEAILRETVTV